MDLGLSGHVILITGGASGIGAAITRACLAEGARVVILSRVTPATTAFMAEMDATGTGCEFVEAELEDDVACRACVERTAGRHGRLDGLVNNAGVNDGVGLEHGTAARFEQSLRTNLLPAYVLARAALPHLKISRGSIVNIASKVALSGQGSTSGYAAAKGALLALTREWAAELLPFSIRVNAVVPAEVMTPLYEAWLGTLDDREETIARICSQIPLEHRMTRPEEIASAVAFLLSPVHSGHTTGQQLVVDGGYLHLDRMLTAAPA